MNRKHNPLVSLAALVLLVTILVWICAGCSSAAAAAETENGHGPRFTIELAGLNLRIITDNETGVQYLAYIQGQGVGLTVLQPGEG